MLPRVCSLAVLVVLASAAVAQPAHPGEPFPLTATRYATARGTEPRLLSNGREPVVFWWGGAGVRMARLVNGRFTMSRVVAEGAYDVVWTGTHFLVVSTEPAFEGGLVARTFDADGDPRGETIRIAAHGGQPRIAFNGRNVLVLYTARVEPTIDFGLHAMVVDDEGRPRHVEPRSLGMAADAAVALVSNGDSFVALVPNVFDPKLLRFDAGGALVAQSVFSAHGAGVALATDGRRYLGVAACREGVLCMPAEARVIEADGTIGAPTELDQPFHTSPTVVWSGTKWLVAYTRDLHLEEAATLQVVQLDADARVIERRHQRPAIEASLGVTGKGVLAAWTTGRYHDVIHVGPIPFDAATSVAASFTAIPQTVLAAESSSRGTLVVWQERGDGRTTLYTGFRATDGSWREREVLSVGPYDCFYCYEEVVSAQLSGNGEEFLLQVLSASHSSLRRLDADGDPLGEPIALPFIPDRILAAGDDYVLLYGERMVARMTPSGTITANKQLPPAAVQAEAIATNDDGELLAARIERTYINHYPHILGLAVVRLDRDFNLVDTTPVRLAADDSSLQRGAAGWDGRQWIVTWNGREGVMAAQLAAEGPMQPRVVRLGEGRTFTFDIEAVPGAAAIRWSNRITFLRHDGTATAPLVAGASERGIITPLPNGDLAYVESSPQHDEPYAGTERATFRVIARVPLPQKPAPPRLTTELLDTNEAVLTWTAPPQPVDGFRVEARVDRGPWSEVAMVGRDVRTLRVPLVPGSRYAFRVRAWNEGGVGISSPIGKRRAAR